MIDTETELTCRDILNRVDMWMPNQTNEMSDSNQPDLDNHADQCNPNNDEYWHSRGWDDRPEEYLDRVESGKVNPDE